MRQMRPARQRWLAVPLSLGFLFAGHGVATASRPGPSTPGDDPASPAEPAPTPARTSEDAKPTAANQQRIAGLHRIQIGASLPDFTLSAMDGGKITRSDFQDRALVLVYLSSEQRHSEHAAGDANRVVKRFADDAIDILFVTAHRGNEAWFQTYFNDARITAPLGFDSGHTLYSDLGLIAFPTTLIFRADGTLEHVLLTRRANYAQLLDAFIAHTLGQIDQEGLEKRIAEPSLTRSSPKTMAQRHREAARLLRDNALNDGAERELMMAIELDPDSTPIRIDLADLYVGSDRCDEAEPLLNAILAVDPDHRSAQLLLGISRFQTGQLDLAEQILLDALQMNPDPERTHYFLGRIYESRGDLAEAVSHYRKALSHLSPE